ncbi:sensor histidine kinase [Virgibacillus kimchii]
MKLQSQLNAAFTVLLIVVMAVTGYFIYSLLMDLLIQDEQRQLRQNGEILVEVLDDRFGPRTDIQQFSNFLEDQDLQLFLYDRNQDAVFFSTMPPEVVNGFFQNNDFADSSEPVWDYGNAKFVNSRILIYPETTGLELILLTPINELHAVQQNFIFRLVIVFIIGAGAAVLLSYFLTNKLVTPLSRLQQQVKKIENRQFDDLERVQATGEIKEVEQSVYEMAKELQRYMNSQQSFFQNASHELKTPLMTIQGYAEGIKEGVFDQEEKEKGLDVMVTEVKRLKTIINEMILLAKLDSEPSVYQPENIEVSYLIDKVVDRALPLVNERGIDLKHRVDKNTYIFADEEKMLRALLNLTFNAIRHADSRINLSVYRESSSVKIKIEDDGAGVPEELMTQLFHRFVKGKNGDTGLGLAIARAIIEQSNGEITVGESEELGGARFEISLERKKE